MVNNNFHIRTERGCLMQNWSDTDTLGKRLFSLRKSSGLNQQKLADVTGISRSNLSKYERDEIQPTSGAIITICNFYNVSSDWLLRGIGQEVQKAEAVFDPDLKDMIDILTELMTSGDPDLRGWTKIQFQNAFKNYCQDHAEKKLNA